MAEPTSRHFGLLGGFPGDAEKLARATALCERLRGPQSAAVTAAEVVDVIATLPFSGRIEFMLQGVCESPSREPLMRALFDSCFVAGRPAEAAGEAQLESVGNDSNRCLDPQRYFLLRLIVVALPRCGRLGVELFQAYQQTTSTVLFRAFLEAMVASPVFTDAELETVFVGAVDASQKAILELCKASPHRRAFLGRLVARKLAPLAMLQWASAADVDALLSQGAASDVAAFEALGFSSWSQFGGAYLAHLRRLLKAKANDPIGKGKVFREFESRVRDPRPADVVELIQICQEQQPLEVAPQVAAEVRAYLEETSKRGALAGAYEGVTLVLPSDRLLHRLRAEDKVAVLRASTTVTPRGWAFAESHQALCHLLLTTRLRRRSAKVLFLDLTREALAAMSEEALWEAWVGNKPDAVQRTFRSFEGFLDLERWRETQLACQAVEAWMKLHQRSQPTAAVVARYAGKKTEAELWTAWTRSAIASVVDYAETVARRSAAVLTRCSTKVARSTITSYIPYLQILVDDVQAALGTKGNQCDLAYHLQTAVSLADAAQELFQRAQVVFAGEAPSVGSKAVAALRRSLEALVVGAMERASASLVFDPAAKNYVTQAVQTQLAPLLVKLAKVEHLTHLPALKSRVLAFCERVFQGVRVPAEAARLGFVEVATPEQKRTFAHFNLAVHKAWSATALTLLTALRASCGPSEADREISGPAWQLFKQEKFGGRVPKRSEKKLGEYLTECLLLPPSVLAAEKPKLVEAAVALLKADEFDPVSETFSRLGWLLEALDACGEPFLAREKYLLKHGDVAVPEVRELMQRVTSDREPTVRMQMHLLLLGRSQSSLAQLATSLDFTAKRIRNEAGLYRPSIYQWLVDRMPSLVTLSLQQARDGDGAAAVRDIDTICEALEKMIRDDVSKRDTVAKGAFRSIAAVLLGQALSFDGSKPLLEARRRWVECGVQLNWIVVRALEGEKGSQAFVWPLQSCTLPRERTVPEAWLPVLQGFLAAHFRAGLGRFDQLRIGVYTGRLQREEGTPERFLAAQAVELLVGALAAVERKPGETTDELAQAKLFPTVAAGTDSPLLRRAQALFAFVRSQWTAVPRLVGFFEAMVRALDEHPTDVGHFRQTLALFDSIRAQYPHRSLWYEVPLLARACDRLLSAAIHLEQADAARALYAVWTELRAGLGRTPIATVLSAAQAQFLIAELGDLDVLETGTLAERRCTSARLLLERTPSSAYVLSSDLISYRDDLVTRYTRKTRGELRGVFDPQWSATRMKESEALQRAPFWVATSLWPTLNGPTMLAYTRDALDEALDLSKSPQARSNAISQFVQSPASSHFEIIDLLKKLMAKPKPPSDPPAPTDEPVDDARELLLETVILCVFQTDAAWFVLAYLLSPEVIAASQRTTAGILTNLPSWVPMDKVVEVLRILLEPQRRWAIQTFLHKAILRLLFDCDRSLARSLFAHEWAARQALQMHADVVHEMVKLAVSALADSDAEKSGIAWSIAEEVARTPAAFGPTTAFLLFLPTWRPLATFAGQRPLDGLLRIAVPNSEVPDSFGLLHGKWLAESILPFSSPQVRDRQASLLRTLAAGTHPYLRTIATCMEFLLSPCAAGIEDEASLHRLQVLLQSLSVDFAGRAVELPKPGPGEKAQPFALSAEEDFFFQVAPKIFASLGLQVLSRKLQGYTEHERQTARALEDVCERQPVAQRLRSVFGLLLETLAQVPPLQVEKRVRLTRVAQGLLSTANEWGFGKPLFTSHFKDALGFLKGDVDRLAPLL